MIARKPALLQRRSQIEQKNKLAQLAPVSGGRGNKGGERETARDLGLDRRQIERSKKIAGLAPEVTPPQSR
jgi:hypothetical protein